jgi:hypothetical protein
MNRILADALVFQKFCQEQDWKFCFIGGLALQRWGEPRMTQDADLTLLTGFGQEAAYIDRILEEFSARIEESRGFALRHRVLLLRGPQGTPLDVALGAMPFEERCIVRAGEHEIAEGCRLIICSAEDLVVHKAFADRPQDWLDIESILLRQHGRINWELIWEELTPLTALKEDPAILDRLRRLRQTDAPGSRSQ